MVIRYNFTGYWMEEAVGALGEEFAWFVRPGLDVVTVDGRQAVKMDCALNFLAIASGRLSVDDGKAEQLTLGKDLGS